MGTSGRRISVILHRIGLDDCEFPIRYCLASDGLQTCVPTWSKYRSDRIGSASGRWTARAAYAGASFLRTNRDLWTTNTDGLTMGQFTAEITAKTATFFCVRHERQGDVPLPADRRARAPHRSRSYSHIWWRHFLKPDILQLREAVPFYRAHKWPTSAPRRKCA
jgi:hypothetical protein